jgi:pilus assembly protein CpaE
LPPPLHWRRSLPDVTTKIRVLIVDDIAETREHLAKLLSFENDIEVIGSAASGEEAVPLATKLQPDVLLLDINMPGLDGIATAEQLSATLPRSAIVMMSVQGEPDYLRRSMLAGAREFLVKPFSADELSAAIRQVHQREVQKQGHMATNPAAQNGRAANGAVGAERRRGRVVTFFSPKGGVGRTTMAVNVAVAAAADMGQKVVIVDASFQFGDVGVLLNMSPKNNTIADLVRELAVGESDGVDSMIVDHSSGVRVLLAPTSPEQAELVTPEHVTTILTALRATHDLVVVDAWPWLNDTTITFLDNSDVIAVLLTLEITNIKNLRQFLGLVETLGYHEGKVKLVLNRADSAYGIRVNDVETSIGRKIDYTIVSDGQTVVYALNRGVPFVLGSKQARVSQDVTRLARAVSERPETTEPEAKVATQPAQRRALLAWR